MTKLIALSNRSVLAVQGPDRYRFLQGLITQDIFLLHQQPAIYSVLLSAQGRFLYDFIITEKDEQLRLEVEVDHLNDLKKRLAFYKLRSQITLNDQHDQWHIYAWLDSFETVPTALQCYAYTDPRLTALGVRLVVPSDYQIHEKDLINIYDDHRLTLGVPDGTQDMIQERAIPLEYNLDKLNAISWSKGCYLGQELTARTKHLGIVRKGVFPALFQGQKPHFGGVINVNNQTVGKILSCNDHIMLCRITKESLQQPELIYEGGFLRPYVPSWHHK